MPTLQKISEAYYIALPVEALKQFNWGKGIRLTTTINQDNQTITISKDPNQPVDKITIFMKPKNKMPNTKLLTNIEAIKNEKNKITLELFRGNITNRTFKKQQLVLEIKQKQLELEQFKHKHKTQTNPEPVREEVV